MLHLVKITNKNALHEGKSVAKMCILGENCTKMLMNSHVDLKNPHRD